MGNKQKLRVVRCGFYFVVQPALLVLWTCHFSVNLNSLAQIPSQLWQRSLSGEGGGVVTATKFSKMSKFGEHHRNLGQILLLERNLASEGSFCIFPYRQNLDMRKNCHCCDSTAACLDTFDICMLQWLRVYMRIFFWSIFGSNVYYARIRADENL